MAESPLSKTYAEIASNVARSAFGYSGTPGNLSGRILTDVQAAMDKGYADFLREHDWNFMKKYTSLTTTAPYSTGTVAMTDSDATVTLTDGTWPSWAAQGTLYYDGSEYSVASRTSDTEIELDETWSGGAVTAGEYELRRVWYTLPDDYGQPESWFRYAVETQRLPMDRIYIPDFEQLRVTCFTSTGWPQKACIKVTESDGTAGQRWEVGFAPLADGAYVIRYGYYILPETRMRDSSPNTPYPLGGQLASDAIEDCCIAAARYLFRDMPLGEYRQNITIACQVARSRDELLGPVIMGPNTDRSDYPYDSIHRRDGEDRIVTVNGITPGYGRR